MENNQIVLKVDKLVKTYSIKNKKDITAVDNISFTVKKGEILGLLGPNGAGKTTIVKMICTLIKPDKGKILINGINNFKEINKSLSQISAVLEGNRNIYWRLTVKENIKFFAALKGINPKNISDEIEYYIDLFDLKEKEDEIASNLSRGMQQKLAIVVALLTQSEILLLDEPTLGLDIKSSYEIRKLLKKIVKEKEITIILTTHDMNVVQDICERVIIIKNGKMITNDKIDNIIRLFNLKSYHFEIKGKLKKQQKRELANIPYLEIEEEKRRTKIILDVENFKYFYEVIDILKRGDSLISVIKNKELNFEKAFIEIINGNQPFPKNRVINDNTQ